MGDVTQILARIEAGQGSANEELLPLVYEQLRKLAAQKMAGQKPRDTLQATALVHEAYIRLVDVETVPRWDSRAHFFAALRLFAGLAVDDVANCLGVSRRTGFRDWTSARAFLQLAMNGESTAADKVV